MIPGLILIGASVISFGVTFSVAWLIGRLRVHRRAATTELRVAFHKYIHGLQNIPRRSISTPDSGP